MKEKVVRVRALVGVCAVVAAASAAVVSSSSGGATTVAAPSSVSLPPLSAVQVTLSNLTGQGSPTVSVASVGAAASVGRPAATSPARPQDTPARSAASRAAAPLQEGLSVQQVTGSAAASGLRAHAAAGTTNIGGGYDLAANGTSTFTANGMRYVYANLKVRNAQSCSTPGTCTAYTTNAKNITLVAAETSTTLAKTAVSKIKLFDGSTPSNAATLAPQIVPTDGVVGNGNNSDGAVYPAPGLESLQLFSESEVADMTPLSGVTSLLPYGYVVKNLKDPTSRTLPANPAANDYEGGVTIAVAFPTQSTATANPFSISLVYQPVTDSNTRVSQSVEEDTQRGDATADARKAALGSSDLAVLGKGHTTATNDGDPICTVRTAGTAAAPTAYLVNGGTSANVASLPYNLTSLSPSAAVNAGFCSPMQTPSGIYSQFVVSGSQSGQRTATGHYTGNYSGGGSTVLSFQPTQPFFTGERVSLTATAALTSSGGKHPAAFVGTSYAGGAVPSSGRFDNYASPRQRDSAFSHTALADFDGDGNLDAVTTSVYSQVQISPGNGDGTFGFPLTITVPNGSNYEVSTADVNGDGKPDLVFLSYTGAGGQVFVYYNTGNFTFSQAGGSPYTITTNSSVSTLDVADFTGDGRPDIAVGNYFGSSVSLLTQNADHSFSVSTPITGTAASPQVVRAADVNGDGKMDIVVGLSNGVVTSYLGTGNGTFSSSASTLATPSGDSRPQILGLALGDLNGDGRTDLVASAYDGKIYVLSGNNTGYFSAVTSLSPPPNATAAEDVRIGDFNDDGRPDIVGSFDSLGGQVEVYLNNGSGSAFSGGTPTQFDGRSDFDSTLAVGDLNGDGELDAIATTGYAPDSLMGDGTGALSVLTTRNQVGLGGSASGQAPVAQAIADVNGDGRLDVVTAYPTSVVASLGTATGAYTTVTSPLSTTPVALVAGDFDGDGIPDLAAISSSSVTFLKGSGTGSFTAQATVTLSAGTAQNAVVGDFNGDGRPDVAIATSGSAVDVVLLNNGSWSFTAKVATSSGSTVHGIDAGDLNGDGKLDLVVTNATGVAVYYGNGDGTFALSSLTGVGAPQGVAIADLNGDLLPDIVVADSGSYVTEMLARPTGGFAISKFATRLPVQTVAVGDVNGDGNLDVVAGSSTGQVVTTFLGSADGLAGPGVWTAVAGGPVAVGLGDMTGTHKLALVVSTTGSNQTWVARQR